eukprot:3409244-Pleurochrysis_carterae.AAC.3
MTLKNNKACCRRPCINPPGQRICPLHQCVPRRCAKPLICLDSTSILLSKVDRMSQTQKEANDTLARLWHSMLHEQVLAYACRGSWQRSASQHARALGQPRSSPGAARTS